MNDRPVGTKVFHTDGPTDIHEEANSAFRSFANVPKNYSFIAIQRSTCCLVWDPYKSHKGTLWQNVKICNVNHGVTQSNHCILQNLKISMVQTSTKKWYDIPPFQELTQGEVCCFGRLVLSSDIFQFEIWGQVNLYKIVMSEYILW